MRTKLRMSCFSGFGSDRLEWLFDVAGTRVVLRNGLERGQGRTGACTGLCRFRVSSNDKFADSEGYVRIVADVIDWEVMWPES